MRLRPTLALALFAGAAVPVSAAAPGRGTGRLCVSRIYDAAHPRRRMQRLVAYSIADKQTSDAAHRS